MNFMNLDVSRVTGFPEFPNTVRHGCKCGAAAHMQRTSARQSWEKGRLTAGAELSTREREIGDGLVEKTG
jgi:hypothetical protein